MRRTVVLTCLSTSKQNQVLTKKPALERAFFMDATVAFARSRQLGELVVGGDLCGHAQHLGGRAVLVVG
jgi:hypothetical protein